MQKVKISQKEIDDVYEIIKEEEITEETPVETPKEEDTTPESVLTEEEQKIDDELFDSLKVEDEIQ